MFDRAIITSARSDKALSRNPTRPASCVDGRQPGANNDHTRPPTTTAVKNLGWALRNSIGFVLILIRAFAFELCLLKLWVLSRSSMRLTPAWQKSQAANFASTLHGVILFFPEKAAKIVF